MTLRMPIGLIEIARTGVGGTRAGGALGGRAQRLSVYYTYPQALTLATDKISTP